MNSVYWINKIMQTMYVDAEGEFWVGLSATEPTNKGSNITEPTGTDYSRVKISEFIFGDDGYVYNKDDLVFPKSTTVWFPPEAKATYWVLFDGADSTANFLSSGELLAPKTVETSTVLTLAAETLGITLLDYEPDLA